MTTTDTPKTYFCQTTGKLSNNLDADVTITTTFSISDLVLTDSKRRDNFLDSLGRNYKTIISMFIHDNTNTTVASVSFSQANYTITRTKPRKDEKPTVCERSQTLNSHAKTTKFTPKPNKKITDTYRDFGPEMNKIYNSLVTFLQLKPDKQPTSKLSKINQALTQALLQAGKTQTEIDAILASVG